MPRRIYKLDLLTPVHFGTDDGGSNLDESRMSFRADVLFSALYRALMASGRERELLSAAQSGSLRFSDAFPYSGEGYYLPKPIDILPVRRQSADSEDPSIRKLMKRISYIRADQYEKYMRNECDPRQMAAEFGKLFEKTSVNVRDAEQPLPYRVGGFRFYENCGLYIIAAGTDKELALLDDGMKLLEAGGIGGRSSSGWGKFVCEKREVPGEIAKLLDNEKGSRQVLLATAYPAEDEPDAILNDACYSLVRRGGFAFSNSASPRRKKTRYAFEAGSTFAGRFNGAVTDTGIDMPHPVWRYGLCLFAGVDR